MVLVEVKGIVDVGSGDAWANDSHQVTYTTIWKEREQDSCISGVMQIKLKTCRLL
jgi:hypothetical protein